MKKAPVLYKRLFIVVFVALVGCNVSKDLKKNGQSCLELKDYARARVFYNKAIEVSPNSFEARYGYALSLSGLLSEKQKLQVPSVEDWLEVTKAYDIAYRLYEQIYHKRIEISSFRTYYKNSLYALADLLYQRQKYYGALETLEKLDQLGLSYPKSIHLNGMIHYQLGFEEESELLFREAIDRDSSYVTAYLNLGSLLLEKDLKAEAAGVLEAAMRVNPDDLSLYLRIEEILEAP